MHFSTIKSRRLWPFPPCIVLCCQSVNMIRHHFVKYCVKIGLRTTAGGFGAFASHARQPSPFGAAAQGGGGFAAAAQQGGGFSSFGSGRSSFGTPQSPPPPSSTDSSLWQMRK